MDINIIRLVIAFCCLAVASYQDIKHREASNKFWVIMGLLGASLLLFEINIAYLMIVPSFILLFYFLFRISTFGGADIKALMALSILLPYPSHDSILPPVISILFYSCIFAVCCIPLLVCLKKDLTIRQVMLKYPFPFLFAITAGVFIYSIAGGIDFIFRQMLEC